VSRVSFVRAVVACAALAAAFVLPAAAGAATITVGTNQDDNVADPGDCEFREAILASNTDTAQDGCLAGSGDDTIDFSLTATITPTSALPALSEAVTLDARADPGCAGTRQITLDGSSAGVDANGLEFDATSNGSTVCGFAIVNFGGAGILLESDDNSIVGNRIGIAAATAAPNDFGVLIDDGSEGNTIGGTDPTADRNVLSGNSVAGVYIEGGTATGSVVEGNMIGTNAAGTAAVPNGQDGIRIIGNSSSNLIGGDGAGEGNVISGNGIRGIYLFDADGNDVQGNFVGTDATGTVALPNGQHGVQISELVNGATNNRIGAPDTSADATSPGARNVISGNEFAGIRISGAGSTGNAIEGNFVGADAAGTAAIPNGTNLATNSAGINIDSSAAGNRIGGPAAGAENLISGNDQNGVWVIADAGANNIVEGNLIGTDRTGGSALANDGAGVQLDGSDTTVGGLTPSGANTIAHNGQDGVSVVAGTGNRILRNSIFSNGTLSSDLGIDLFPGGVEDNDPLDPDIGANNLQNFPVLTGAQTNSVDTTVQGTLNSTASRAFRVEFFSNPACDTAGNGEGKTFLGTTDVTTDGAGNATIAATVLPATVDHQVTATATDAVTDDTSEFSACRAVAAKAEPPAPPPPDPTPDPIPDPGTGGGGGGGTGGGGGAPDTKAPVLDVGGDSKQDSDKKVKVEVSCDEDCTVDAEGTIKVPEKFKDGKVKSKEKFDLKGADELELEAGDTKKLKLEFKNKAADLVEKAFKEKEKSTAKVTATATDGAGNETDEKFEIKVKK
jgi:parallel beta-helix repeat protein